MLIDLLTDLANDQPTDLLLPVELERVFALNQPDALLTALMPALCEVWQCERCFLCLRDPATTLTRITHSYCKRDDREDLIEAGWVLEDDVILNDPLMILAFQTAEAVYVEDVETADATVVDLAYEQQVFKNRALIHAPIYVKGNLYGILEPCVFDQPRVWSEYDRWVTVQMQQRLGKWVLRYLIAQGIVSAEWESLTWSTEQAAING